MEKKTSARPALGTDVSARYGAHMSIESRMIDLETRVAYQDQLIAQLDEVIREFAGRVEALERKAKEKDASTDADIGPANDPPPHY
ncbi:MAG: putative coiled-coil protein SlyX [Myxococcota bacterium]